jgi:hypothetical protein
MKTHVQNLVRELVERRLWPVALLLAVALAAVPVFLGRTGDPASVDPGLPAGPAPGVGPAQKAEVTLDTSAPVRRDRAGDVRDPFKAPKAKKVEKAATTASPAPAASATPSESTSASPSTITVSGGPAEPPTSTPSTGSAGGRTTPRPSAPATPAKKKATPKTTAKPKADNAKDTYHVDLEFGVNGAEPNKIEDVARLSPLPSVTDPFFVFLGVLETKAHQKRAVFLVSSDATPNDEGSCHPTKTDCESVELAVGQTAFFDYAAPDGTPTQYELKLAKIRKTAVRAEARAAAAVARHSVAGAELLRDAAVRDVRAAAGARAYRFVPALGTLVRAKRKHVSTRAAAAGKLIPGLALVSSKHQPGIPVWHSPKK